MITSCAAGPLARDDDSWQTLPFHAEHHVDDVLLVDPAGRTVNWLALRDQPVQASGLIELGPTELAEHLDWPKAPGTRLAPSAAEQRDPDQPT